MKRFVSICLCILMLVALAACGKPQAPADSTPAADSNATVEKESNYPEHAINIIVATSAGGSSDNYTRLVAPYLEKELGVTVTVTNMPGANTETGMSEVMNSNPDGYTLGANGSGNFRTLLSQSDEITYDKFLPLATFGKSPFGYGVKPDSRFKTLDELVAYAKEHPGEITVSCPGAAHKLLAYMFMEAAGIELTIMEVDGGGDSLNAVLGGHVELASLTLAQHASLASNGGRWLAACGDNRYEAFPDVPLFKDYGYDINMDAGSIIYAPVGMPDDVVKKLQNAFEAVSKNEEIKNKITESGLAAVYESLTGEGLDTAMSQSIGTIKEIIERLQLKL